MIFNLLYKFNIIGLGLVNSIGEKWHSRRKMITPAFHFSILQQFVDVFDSEINIMINKLKSHVNGDDFNIYQYINLAALDAICSTSLGLQFNAQNNPDAEYVKLTNL